MNEIRSIINALERCGIRANLQAAKTLKFSERFATIQRLRFKAFESKAFQELQDFQAFFSFFSQQNRTRNFFLQCITLRPPGEIALADKALTTI